MVDGLSEIAERDRIAMTTALERGGSAGGVRAVAGRGEQDRMVGFGTVLNVIGVLVGGICGLLFGKRFSYRYQETLTYANGICVLFLGVAGTLEKMMAVENGFLTSGGTMMMVASLAIGSMIGEWINLEQRMEDFGNWLREKTKNEGDTTFVDGFVTASLTICIGAMAIVGPIQDALQHDYSTLMLKAILDAIIILVMTAAMGKGCIFSAIPIALFQGSVTILARFIEPIMLAEPQALANLSLVGNILIFCIGTNIIWGKKFRVANMLPAIVIAVACAYIGIW